MPRQKGDLISNRYRCLDIASVGQFDRIHAKDELDADKDVYLLRLTDINASNPKSLENFRLHASTMEMFASSRYIANVLDVQIPHQAGSALLEDVFFVTDYLPSRLPDIGAKEVTTEKKLTVLASLLHGLRDLHLAGILHLRLSPEGVGLSADLGEVKLLDLGNCHPIDKATVVSDTIARYTAPEMYKESHQIGGYSDVYSVGHLFYEYLCSDSTHSDTFSDVLKESSAQVQDRKWINWHQGVGSLPPLSQHNSLVGSVSSDALAAMIDKDHTRRPANAEAALNALTNIPRESAAMVDNVGSAKTGKFPEAKKPEWQKPIYLFGVPLAILSVSVSLYFTVIKPPVKPPPKKPVISMHAIDSLRQEAVQKQNVAISLSSEGTSALLQQASASMAAANAFIDQDKRDLAKSSLLSADKQFVEVISKAGGERFDEELGRLKSAQSLAEKVGTVGVDELIKLDVSRPGAWNTYEPTLDNLREATLKLQTAVETNDRNIVIGSTEAEIDDAFELCRSFSDACKRSWYEDEAVRPETLKPFALDEKEVTVAEFSTYVASGNVKTKAEERNKTGVRGEGLTYTSSNENLYWYNAYPKEDGSAYSRDDGALRTLNMPVVHITRIEASRYCRTVGKRLPSEAEWEYAARGAEGHLYSWGNALSEIGKYRGSQSATNYFPVGSFKQSAAGHYDLGGSVSEWTISDTTGDFPVLNEDGASTIARQQRAVVKGGSRFDENHANLRLAVRRYELKDYSGNDVGFRCASPLEKWPR